MRLLVRGPNCLRQYDATGRAVGSRFRCHCGQTVEVQAPEGHDAAVVRCSSCGAPRQDGAASCPFCHSDFTLHDRDLDTVCPACFARVSDHAKFCHHCGTALTPEPAGDGDTPLICPACGHGKRLVSRRLGDVSALECGVCAGLWVGIETFNLITQKAAHDPAAIARMIAPDHARAAEQDIPPPAQTVYRPCPACHDLMVRKNYGHESGVIIDWCGDHGIWFDDDELSRIIDWIRTGGLTTADKETAARIVRKREQKQSDESYQASRSVFGQSINYDDDELSPSIISTVFRTLADLF